ncbi:MAG TPA: hypothetical protein VF170_07445 [Planctomycetaceae bacterium]
MSVSLETVREFVGASSSDDSALREDLGTAVDLLAGYLRHLRQLEDGVLVGRVSATY